MEMTILRVLLFIAISALSSVSFAKCNNSEKAIFSCLTTKAKQIEVCDAGKTISYSFGYPNTKPEIVLNIPRAKVFKEHFMGTGCISSSIEIPNGNTVYKVYAVETLRDEECPEAGVEVIVKQKTLATVKCKNPENITNNIADAELLEK